MKQIEEGKIFTKIVLEVFKLGGLFVNEGDRLTKPLGLTSARWKILGAISLSEEAMTVAKIAKTMGQTRQGVQRIADEMASEGIVEYQENPNHKRAKLLFVTDKGKSLYESISELQVPWAEKKAEGICLKDLQTTLSTLRQLTKKCES